MHTLNLYTFPENTSVSDDDTSLCVFDENNNLVADYDLNTGLRLVRKGVNLTIYINNNDLVPGSWVLFLGILQEDRTIEKEKVKGLIEGTSVERDYASKTPWSRLGNLTRVNLEERKRRLSICTSCPLLNPEGMTCSVTNKLVTHATTIREQFCPEDNWGNKQQVLAETVDLEPLHTARIDKKDQDQFEAELDSFLNGLE